MVEKRSISVKIAQLREYIRILKFLQKKANLDAFVKNFEIHGLAERYLHLAIENILDIADTIITQKDFRKPESYPDTILILVENKVLPEKFGIQFSKIAGFRNILVHNYISIDHEKVFHYLQENLTDLQKFLKYVVKFLNE